MGSGGRGGRGGMGVFVSFIGGGVSRHCGVILTNFGEWFAQQTVTVLREFVIQSSSATPL
ncbi:MAG: hypothetical protein DSM106950_07570 [Stigonema ocellatum SAG 48.90 = DSM 106950]|nr:hypothetical protein [Stigonema ocellatum SAG 48.90 = DSM 106950]